MKMFKSITNNTASVADAEQNPNGITLKIWATIDSSAITATETESNVGNG